MWFIISPLLCYFEPHCLRHLLKLVTHITRATTSAFSIVSHQALFLKFVWNCGLIAAHLPEMHQECETDLQTFRHSNRERVWKLVDTQMEARNGDEIWHYCSNYSSMEFGIRWEHYHFMVGVITDKRENCTLSHLIKQNFFVLVSPSIHMHFTVSDSLRTLSRRIATKNAMHKTVVLFWFAI